MKGAARVPLSHLDALAEKARATTVEIGLVVVVGDLARCVKHTTVPPSTVQPRLLYICLFVLILPRLSFVAVS